MDKNLKKTLANLANLKPFYAWLIKDIFVTLLLGTKDLPTLLASIEISLSRFYKHSEMYMEPPFNLKKHLTCKETTKLFRLTLNRK